MGDLGDQFGFGDLPDNTRFEFAEDFNGQFCKSGLAIEVSANTAECVEVDIIKFDGTELADPYPCTATDTDVKCQLFYTSTDFIERECRCGLDGNHAYCSSIVGTDVYKEAVDALQNVYDESNCHTLD